MKKLLSVLFCCISLSLIAQQANVWHFGRNAGLDFNNISGGYPTPIQSSIYTAEGCASVSDQNGNAFFYTDGRKIYNSYGGIVTSSLLGDGSSTQSAVVVPRPNSNNYFVFTVDNHGGPNGIHFTEVTKLSNGLPAIVGGTLNTPLIPTYGMEEKIAVACHANGKDYWVTVISGHGVFSSFLVDDNGVNLNPVSSPISAHPSTNSSDDLVGYMKISRQGHKLAIARRAYNSVNQLFNYDNSTGKVTSLVGTYYIGTAYGLEFSEDGNYMYSSERFVRIKRYSTSNVSSPVLIKEYTGAWSNYSLMVGALQMGPDGKIYVARGYENNPSSYLDVIGTPNGVNPNYVSNAIQLYSGTKSELGLPDLVSCFVPNGGCTANPSFDYSESSENCKLFSFENTSSFSHGDDVVSWSWDFGDGTGSSEENPIHQFDAAGSYDVCLKMIVFTGVECCEKTECRTITVANCADQGCKAELGFTYSYDNDLRCLNSFSGYTSYTNAEVIGWFWDFGDGNTGVGQNPQHIYAADGTYVVCVNIVLKNGNGECCVYQACNRVSTAGCKEILSDNPKPSYTTVDNAGSCGVSAEANYAVSDENCKLISFKNNSVFSSGMQPIAWRWRFGDGTYSSEQHPTHEYTASGQYQVCLEVIAAGEKGCCIEEHCFIVNVQNCPKPTCKADPFFTLSNLGDFDCIYQFNGDLNFVNGEVISWIWDFGDGSSATGQDVQHFYENGGDFTICLTVLIQNDNGECCYFNYCEMIAVKGCTLGSGKKGTSTGHIENRDDIMRVYPVPASDELVVELTLDSDEVFKVSIVTLLGREYKVYNDYSLNQGKNMIEINTSHLTSGTYILMLESGNGRMVRKFNIIK